MRRLSANLLLTTWQHIPAEYTCRGMLYGLYRQCSLYRRHRLVIISLLLLLTGCQPPLPDFSSAKPFSNLEQKRIERYSEWRDVRRIPAGSSVFRLETSPVGKTGRLRLGLLEGEPNSSKADFRIYIGDRLIKHFHTGMKPEWHDYAFDFNPAGKPVYLAVESEHTIWAGPCRMSTGSSKADTPPNLLVFLIDTMRQDHAGCYGYSRDTTPHIDAFAEEALRFTQLMPQSSWTRPSVATLLSGSYPELHGANDRPDKLRGDIPSLPEFLQKKGYETQAFVTNVNLLPLWGFGRGFTRFVDVDSENWANCDDAEPVDHAIAALNNLGHGTPWFLYVHAMGPHDPYEPPGGYDRRFTRSAYEGSEEEQQRLKNIDLYDGEIAYTDAQFGRLKAALEDRGFYDNTLIIVLSDHGEEFYEHGDKGHGKTLFEEMLRVPLLIRLPGGRHAGQVRNGLIEMADLAPTITDLFHLPDPPPFQGKSMAPLIEKDTGPDRIGYASLVHLDLSMRCAKDTFRKYIRDTGGGHRESWFDLKADPQELKPLENPPEGAERLKTWTFRRATAGAAGLHLLMTCGTEKRTLTGSVTSADIGHVELDYYEWKSLVTRQDNQVSFELKTIDPMDHFRDRDRWHNDYAEQDNAHLIIDLPPDAPFALDLRIDGEAVLQDLVFMGADGSHAATAGVQLMPRDLLAAPDAWDPAAVPRQFAIYLWYVATPGAVEKENLPAEMREAMEGLGYL